GAALPHHAVPDGLARGERTGVRHGRAGAGFGLPALPDNDGLALAGFAERFEEAAAILHAFDVHADDLGFVVEGEVFEVVRDIEDDGVAEADAAAEVHAVRRCDGAEIGRASWRERV